MGRSKGSNLHHMRSWVQQRGVGSWDELLMSMAERDRDELRGLVSIGWYDLALQHRLLRAIDQRFGVGDGSLADRIGVYEADQDLRVVHRLFLRFSNPAGVLEKAGGYWSRFYDTGRWEVTREGENAARGVLSGVDPFDPLFGRYLIAYIRRMWELVGAKRLRVETHIEKDHLIVEGSWS